jgi:hypothetical protein
MTYEVTISYSDSTGKRHYADPSVLDLSMYLGTGGIHHDGVHDLKQLKQISDNLKRWTDTDGLKIMSRADIRQRSAEREAHYEERQAAAALKRQETRRPAGPRL